MTTTPKPGMRLSDMHVDQWNAIKEGRRVERRARRQKKKRGRYKLRHEGRCRLCARSARVRPLTRHHLVPVSIGGSWDNDNIVPLCRMCHDTVDASGYRNRHDALVWRSMLRRILHPGELGYVRRTMGEQWLDWNYPDIRELHYRRFAAALNGTPRGKVTTAAFRRELARIGARMADLTTEDLDA